MTREEAETEPLIQEFVKRYRERGPAGKILADKMYQEKVVVGEDGTITTVGELTLGRHVITGKKVEPPKYDPPKG